MSETVKHTPGNWFAGTKETDPGEWDDDYGVWVAPTPEEIADAVNEGYDSALPHEVCRCTNKADVWLIAASKDLLAALERLMDERCPFEADADSCECGELGTGYDEAGSPCEHIQARRAIAKATGGES